METETNGALVNVHHPLIRAALKNVQWNSGHDEYIEVNRWTFADNISARYSGELLMCLTYSLRKQVVWTPACSVS